MSIRRIFITIAAVMLTSAVFADSASVTSKKYVDDFMVGYQNKIPGSGTDKLMIYDESPDGIGEKNIVSSLGSNTSAADVPNVGAVKAGMDGKQDTINGTAGYVMTGMGTNRPGEIGERAIYGTAFYGDSLVTAENVNDGVINAVNSSLIRVDANGNPSDSGTLWEINTDLFAIGVLPAGYTQLEYVNMNAGSYLGVENVPVSSSYKVEFDFQTTSLSSSLRNYIGGRANGVAAGGGFRISHMASSVSYGLVMYGFDTSDAYETRQVSITANTRYKYVYDNGTCTLSSGDTVIDTHTYTVNDATSVTKWGINSYYGGSSYTTANEGIYVYSVKVWDANGNLVLNYIPATQTNPSVVGFYDTVSGTFKVATSGTFEPGPAVAGN